MTHTTISSQFFLSTELIFIWAFTSYGITGDPLADESTTKKQTTIWRLILMFRSGVAALLAFWISHSVPICLVMLAVVGGLPIARKMVPTQWITEVDCCSAIALITFILWYVECFKLVLASWLFILPLSKERIAALCLVGAVLLFLVRGGTYIVRGLLKRAGTLPHVPAGEVDTAEVSRGRLIGNIERILLTIVVAAGSYAALGFLVAAKGLIRAEELGQRRDFSEYFLVGSLASVLVALCAGLLVRFVLLTLWPELLSLQMQAS